MTVQTASEPPVSEPSPVRAGTWKFWGTTLWGVAILATFSVVGMTGMLLAMLFMLFDPHLPLAQRPDLLLSRTGPLSVTLGLAALAAAAVLARAVRLSGIGARAYLGLIRPRRSDVMVGLAGVVVLYAAFVLAGYLAAYSPPLATELYQSALAANRLPALVAALVILAPVGEELLFRGFLLRGWADSRLGAIGAILLTAALWTTLHTQYDLFTLVYVFCLGLLLGGVRLRSGSTLLTIGLHSFQNATVLVHTAMIAGSA